MEMSRAIPPRRFNNLEDISDYSQLRYYNSEVIRQYRMCQLDTWHSFYRFEFNRMRSFDTNWEVWFRQWQYPHPTDLAIAGFFYTGKKDIVKCFECHIKLGYWQNQLNPWLRHSIASDGQCRFVRRYSCGDVPCCADSASIFPHERTLADTVAMYGRPIHPYAVSDSIYSADSSTRCTVNSAKLRASKCPQCPQYLRHFSDKDTPHPFETRFNIMIKMKEKPASVGSYNISECDQTNSYCELNLYDWESEDDSLQRSVKCISKNKYAVKKLDEIVKEKAKL